MLLVPAPQLTVTVEAVFAEPMVMPPPVPWTIEMPVEPVPPLIVVNELPTSEPIVTRFVPEPVGVPSAMCTVLPPATVVGLVAMLIVSTKPLPVPVVLPMAIVRAAAGLLLPSDIAVTRLLLPRLNVAVPPLPLPERIPTVVVPLLVLPLAMLMVSPLSDWPKVNELPELLVLPMLILFAFVVPMLIEPLAAACTDTPVPEPPWINTAVLAEVLPMVWLRAVAPMIIEPLVVLAEPVSIVTLPELLKVESPDLIVTAPVDDGLPVPLALPERKLTPVDGVEAAVWSAVWCDGATAEVPK